MEKSPDAFRTISEVADELNVPQHVLRFWETRFTQIKPMKRAGGRRYYRPADVDLVRGIRVLLYGEGYTIRGVQKIFKDDGAATIVAIGRGEAKARKPELLAEKAPPPGMAKAAPRIVKAVAPPVGRAPLARPIGEAPKVIHKLTGGQTDTLKAALRDLTDARKLLDPTTR
ncbi:MerR family transcriptional regulator [Aestuariivirga sp.]|uniref:MerR family transcriptional regulator n=1 Tax=Aestuariivirga sp. TaxID=2650926 RepID=UPI0039E44E6D